MKNISEQNASSSLLPVVRELMTEYACTSGLSPAGRFPLRYLWTDAFAVCNFLTLYRRTGDDSFRNLALLLVDQVHAILGRHRGDDSGRGRRTGQEPGQEPGRKPGWISGLDEQEGALHPAIGGLRIGKTMNERRQEEPFDEVLEWERDGQYYHYLTQWMHALDRVSRVTGDPAYNRWAMELAKTAHARFAYVPASGGQKRMYWKMSIDLSYPLVPSMGHHDPLDGLVTYSELRATARHFAGRSAEPEAWPDLDAEIADMIGMCTGKSWTTDDPLGIGSLLIGADRMAHLILHESFPQPDLLEEVMNAALEGLSFYASKSSLKLPSEYRLAFRELGLAIGLHAAGRVHEIISQNPGAFSELHSLVERLIRYAPLREAIQEFWLERSNWKSGSWAAHRAINMVMLAASLLPGEYLSLE